jgi:hypothetical protein
MRSPTLLNAKSYVAMSATRRIAFAGAVALLIVLTLFTAAEEASVSDAQFNAKLITAAAAVDVGLSNVQQFFPASFR